MWTKKWATQGLLLIFQCGDYWNFLSELRTRVGEELMLIVVGNKKDLTEGRVVSVATAKEYATSINAPFIETSALDNTG